jgi:N-acetylneuraminic acid mutarotase
MQTSLLLLFLQAASIPHLSWQSRAHLPIPAAGGYYATLHGKIVYAGGSTWENGVKRFLTETHIYDPATDRWSAGPKLPKPLAYGAFAHTKRGLEILGGTDSHNSSRDCWVLESATANWKKCGGDPGDTVLASALAVGEEVVVFGGCPNLTELARCSASVRLKDASGRWSVVGEMPQGKASIGASAVLGGSVYLFGGVSGTAGGAIENHAEAYRFSLRDRQWKRLRNLPRAARGMTAVAWDRRYILLAGGYVASQAEAAGKPPDFGFTGDVLVYDTVTDQYQSAGALPLPCAGLAMLRVGEDLFAMGGEEKMRSRSAQVLRGRVVRIP